MSWKCGDGGCSEGRKRDGSLVTAPLQFLYVCIWRENYDRAIWRGISHIGEQMSIFWGRNRKRIISTHSEHIVDVWQGDELFGLPKFSDETSRVKFCVVKTYHIDPFLWLMSWKWVLKDVGICWGVCRCGAKWYIPFNQFLNVVVLAEALIQGMPKSLVTQCSTALYRYGKGNGGSLGTKSSSSPFLMR